MAISRHNLRHQPVALWQFDGDTNDVSGNAFNMSAETGTVRYMDLFPGFRGAWFDGSTNTVTSSYQAALNILGDLTIEALVYLPITRQSTNAIYICESGNSGETGTVNIAYSAWFDNAGWTWLSESGAGVDATFASAKVAMPAGLFHYAVTRLADVVTLYINGAAVATSSALVTPTDGSASRVRAWGSNQGPNALPGGLSSLKVIARALSAAEVKEEYSSTLGVFYASHTLPSPWDIQVDDFLRVGDYVGDTYSVIASDVVVTDDYVWTGAPVQLHDTTYSPVGLWQFQGNLNDTSGNGRTLTSTGSGNNVYYTEIFPGVQGFQLDTSTSLQYTTTGTSLQITGDVTLEMMIVLPAVPSNIQIVFYGVAGETLATNYLYGIFTDDTTANGLQWFSENGAGIDGTYSLAESPPRRQLCHLAATRASNIVQFYINGVAAGPASSAITTPTGGTSSFLQIGGASSPMIISSLKIVASALTGTQVLGEYNRTMGRYFGER